MPKRYSMKNYSKAAIREAQVVLPVSLTYPNFYPRPPPPWPYIMTGEHHITNKVKVYFSSPKSWAHVQNQGHVNTQCVPPNHSPCSLDTFHPAMVPASGTLGP